MLNRDKPDDGYGEEWDYRVVSRPDTDPDAPRDQRYLVITGATIVITGLVTSAVT